MLWSRTFAEMLLLACGLPICGCGGGGAPTPAPPAADPTKQLNTLPTVKVDASGKPIITGEMTETQKKGIQKTR